MGRKDRKERKERKARKQYLPRIFVHRRHRLPLCIRKQGNGLFLDLLMRTIWGSGWAGWSPCSLVGASVQAAGTADPPTKQNRGFTAHRPAVEIRKRCEFPRRSRFIG
jgi:hypothetical protein